MDSIAQHAGHFYVHRTLDILIGWFEDFYEDALFLSNGVDSPIRISKWPIKHRFYVDIHYHGRPNQYDQLLNKVDYVSLQRKFGICNPIPERWLNRPEEPDDEPTEEEWKTFKHDMIHSNGGTSVLLFVNHLKWTVDLSLFRLLLADFSHEPEIFEHDLLEHADYLQRFEGYSLCVPERWFIERWDAHWPSIGRIALANRQRSILDIGSPEPTSSQVGRPRKREALANCYRAMFPEGNRGIPWKQVLREIERQHGISGSVETLKRGLKIDDR